MSPALCKGQCRPQCLAVCNQSNSSPAYQKGRTQKIDHNKEEVSPNVHDELDECHTELRQPAPHSLLQNPRVTESEISHTTKRKLVSHIFTHIDEDTALSYTQDLITKSLQYNSKKVAPQSPPRAYTTTTKDLANAID